MASPSIIDVDEAGFQQRVIEASRTVPVVVDFWAGWCQPCLILGPVLERLAGEYGGRFVLARVDVDANPALASSHGVQGIPAVKAFRDGTVVSEFVGVQPEEIVRRFLDHVVPSAGEDEAVAARAAEDEGDLDGAEILYRKALAADPSHAGAAAGLARTLARLDRIDEAREALGPVAHTDEARPVAALLELRDQAGADGPLGGAAAAATDGDPRSGLEACLRLIEEDGADRDPARETMVRIFEVLGPDSPLVGEYRPRLARALY